MTITKYLAAFSAFAIFATAQANSPMRNKSLDRLMYTINPEVTLNGPVYNDKGTTEDKSKYASELVNLIIKEAHLQALPYLEAGDTQAYYTILTMALTVPLHEGLYVQFRSTDAEACRADANSGELIKKSSETTYAIFNDYFKKSEKPFLPNCEQITSPNVTQIIRGGDGSDLSVMQVSIRWHFEDFLANKKYESVKETLKYGIGHLMSGFNPIYRNIGDYSCLMEKSGGFFKKKKISYVNLIRGTWAGKYNSGSIAKTCRFNDSMSPYKGHDVGFARNLDKVLNFNGTLVADLVGEFKIAEKESMAIKEIVNNFKNNLNERSQLESILNTL